MSGRSGDGRVAVVDAGLGNLRSVEKALRHVGADVVVTSDPAVVDGAARVVVPGQGAFADCGRALAREAPLGASIRRAIDDGRPYLGICLGLQVLFDESEEAPGCRGLGVLAGRVVKIPTGERDPSTGARIKVPHMGWNRVDPVARPHPLLGEPSPFYFVHSYYADPVDRDVLIGAAEYGGRSITAAVARANVFAVQFHPEKSQRAGLDLLAAFLRWSPSRGVAAP